MQLPESLADAVTLAGAKVRVGYPWWLRGLLPGNVLGITLGRRIYLAREFGERAGDALLSLVRHELQHVRQVNRYGLPLFLLLYLWQFLLQLARLRSWDGAYATMPFEVEARRAEEGEIATGL